MKRVKDIYTQLGAPVKAMDSKGATSPRKVKHSFMNPMYVLAVKAFGEFGKIYEDGGKRTRDDFEKWKKDFEGAAASNVAQLSCKNALSCAEGVRRFQASWFKSTIVDRCNKRSWNSTKR